MRIGRVAAVGATLIALFVGACGPGAGSPRPASPGPVSSPSVTGAVSSPSTTGAAGTLASAFVFGGPPECPQRPFCLIGLRETYGLEFREFRPLDTGGPLTVEALANGDIDVALLFTTDPVIEARSFVLLEDDMRLQRADNLLPIISQSIIDEHPAVADLLNGISARLTQEELIELNRQSSEDREDPRDIADGWLDEQGLFDDADPSLGAGADQIVVGKTNFPEQDILSELYAQILEINGFTVGRLEASGTREVVFPALESGQINVLPDYAASALEFANGGAGEATADADETTTLLREHLEPLGLVALDAAPAANQNAIVVTQELADTHGLETISDLAQPAP